MSVQLPVYNEESADFEYNIDLDAVNMTIRLTWNTRVEYWFMSISTTDTEIQGVKITENFLLLDQYKASLYNIPGDFIIQKISDDIGNNTLTYSNLGVNWGLFYFDEDEVEEFKTENGI